MNFTYYKSCLLLLGGLLVATSPVSAKDTIESSRTNRDRSAIYLTRSSKSNTKTKAREYTFKAPDSKIINNSEQLTKVRGYKVEVYGDKEDLLRVKDIEPTAFIKEDVIQVGIFSEQNNAEDMVRKLAAKGLWSRIVEQ